MKNIFRILFPIILIAIISEPTHAQWVQTNGPHNRATSEIYLARNGSTVLAGMDGTYEGWGCYVSTDNGQSWTSASNGLPDGASVEGFAMNGGYYFAAVDGTYLDASPGVYLSTNSGATWTYDRGFTGNYVNAFAMSGGTLFAASDSIFASTDNGATWTTPDTGLPGGNSVTYNSIAVNGATLLAAPFDNFDRFVGGIYRSTNYGATWHPADNGLPWAVRNSSDTGYYAYTSIAMGPKGTIYAGSSYGGGVFVSTDDGLSWDSTGLSENNYIYALAVSGTNVIAANDSAIFVSTDGGRSWTNTTSPLGNVSALSFAVNGSDVLAGASNGVLLHSNDGGLTWQTTEGITLDSYSPIYVLSSWGNNVYGGARGAEYYYLSGVHVTTDDGASWTSDTTGMGEMSVAAVAANGTGLFAGTGDGIFRSTDNGSSWTQFAFHDTSITALLSYGNYLFASSPLSGLFLSTDNGSNWVRISTMIGSFPDPYVTEFAVSPEDSLIFAIDSSPAAAGGGIIYASIGNPRTWSYLPHSAPFTPGNATSIAAADSDVFVGTTSGAFRYVPRAGWTKVDSGLSDTSIRCFAASGATVFAGTDSGVFVSTDLGAIWSSASSGLPDTSIVAFTIAGSNIYAAIAGRGVWKRPLSQMTTAVRAASTQLPGGFSLSQNYPNPFNPSTTINYQLPTNSFVSLAVFDVLGREVKTLVNRRQNAGDHTVTFNAANLPSGVYFYRLEAGTYHDTKKLMLLK